MERNVRIIDHPLAQHWATILCDRTTPMERYREATEVLALVVAMEVLSTLRMETCAYESLVGSDEQTPGAFPGNRITVPITVISILRSGEDMVPPFCLLCPWVTCGTIGVERDECTAFPIQYYCKFPESIARGIVIVVDPMLATGGSAEYALHKLVEEYGVEQERIMLACFIAAPEGIEYVTTRFPGVRIIAAKMGEGLTERRKYIQGGPGDHGDRYRGTQAGASGLLG